MKYPEWVIPDGVDLDQLRATTEQLIAEFSRPVERWLYGAGSYSNPRAWRYAGTDFRQRKQWRFCRRVIPSVYLSSAVACLKQPTSLRSVLQATMPFACLEDYILEDPDRSVVSVSDRRNFRLEWLKMLKEKLDESE